MANVTTTIVEYDEAKTADDFLKKLHPLHERWQPNPDIWAFRGHGDAEWKLLPAANRKEPWSRYVWNAGAHPQHDPTSSVFDHEKFECELIWMFYTELDNAGLEVPEGNQFIRQLAVRRFGFLEGHGAGRWPDERLCPLIALAQHHGIPTRLLDWSYRGPVAAYFAAFDALGLGSVQLGPDGDLAVWAVRTTAVRRTANDNPKGISVDLVTAPQASNPNLNAQAGVFTLCRGEVARDARVIPLDEAVGEIVDHQGIHGKLRDQLPVFWRITLPRSEAPKLLRLLSYDGVTGAKLFPGPSGCERSVREKRNWDKPPHWRNE